MNPQTVSEKMMYSTVRMCSHNGSCGTGFFYTFCIDEKTIPVLITNQHVVEYNDEAIMSFYLHLKEEDGSPSESNVKIDFQSKWYFHKTQDICFAFVNPLFEFVKEKTGKSVYNISLDRQLIYDRENLKQLSALEPVVMVGYPNGLWDEQNNFPLFRTGFTSNHPSFDFNSVGIGVVDMACFPGSSGSPIFIINETGYNDKNGNFHLGAKRIIFLGILSSGPVINLRGEVIETEVPVKKDLSSMTKSMMNLGYYIKAYELLEFEHIIKELCSIVQ